MILFRPLYAVNSFFFLKTIETIKIKKFYLRNSSDIAPTSSIELAELIVPGDGGIEPPLNKRPDDELSTESAELPVHGTDGTLKYLKLN